MPRLASKRRVLAPVRYCYSRNGIVAGVPFRTDKAPATAVFARITPTSTTTTSVQLGRQSHLEFN